jgi:hypothetical protein
MADAWFRHDVISADDLSDDDTWNDRGGHAGARLDFIENSLDRLAMANV